MTRHCERLGWDCSLRCGISARSCWTGRSCGSERTSRGGFGTGLPGPNPPFDPVASPRPRGAQPRPRLSRPRLSRSRASQPRPSQAAARPGLDLPRLGSPRPRLTKASGLPDLGHQCRAVTEITESTCRCLPAGLIEHRHPPPPNAGRVTFILGSSQAVPADIFLHWHDQKTFRGSGRARPARQLMNAAAADVHRGPSGSNA